MSLRKKFLGFPLLLVVLSSIFTPSANALAAADVCDGAIAHVGQKYVNIQLEDLGATKSYCISVPKDQKTIGINELNRIAQGLKDNNRPEAAVWNFVSHTELTVEIQGKSCAGNGAWRSYTGMDKKLSDIVIGITDTPSCGVLMSEDVGGNGRQPIITYEEQHPQASALRKRYMIEAGNNRTLYLSYGGEQEVSATTATATESCTLLLQQKRPECLPPSAVNVDLMTPSSILEYMKKTASIPVDCQKDIEDCIAKSVPTPDDQAVKDLHANDPHYQKPAGYAGPLPDCSFSYQGCRNINDLLELFINLGKTLFQVIGTFAFVMFIYGGFTIIMSMGNSEKVKKGQEVLVAAVVGLIISFGAFLIIDFVLDALQVSNDFRAVGILQEVDQAK